MVRKFRLCDYFFFFANFSLGDRFLRVHSHRQSREIQLTTRSSYRRREGRLWSIDVSFSPLSRQHSFKSRPESERISLLTQDLTNEENDPPRLLEPRTIIAALHQLKPYK
jgi:hypothetical protein